MSVKTVVGGRLVVHVFAVVAVIAGVLALTGALDAALAQAGPLGVSRPQALAAPVGGVVMGVGTAITVAIIAMIAVAAGTWAKRFTDSRSGYGMRAMRGIEAGAALVIIAFGSLLLTGYIVTERMVGV
jgi:hypothetical protein